jgi:hypothetical protein
VIKIQPGTFRTRVVDGIFSSYEKTLSTTAYYQEVLKRMKPLMVNELKHGKDPRILADTLIKAVESPKPKLKYRIGTGKLLCLMNILPDPCLDGLYRWIFRSRNWMVSRVLRLLARS